jgi:uncharacterized membrane protein
MYLMKAKFVVLIVIVGLLSACAGQAGTPASASQPTEQVVPATEAPTDIPAPTAESTATSEPAVTGSNVSFAVDIRPILESRCINCHGGDRIEEGLILTSHASILAGSENGAVVSPGDAANSLLAELVANKKMPKRGPKLTPPQVQLIVDWINQGALDN